MLTEQEILTALLGLSLMLGSAKLLGEAFSRLRLPVVVGEIVAGIIIGPTVMGRLFPNFTQWIFPVNARIFLSIEFLALLGVIFLLIVAGLEVDLSSVLKQGKSVLMFSFLSLIIPFFLGSVSGYLFPEIFGSPLNRIPIMLFLGTALSITALPIIAKVLMDLQLLKSDLGMLILSIAMINDLLGWLIFSVIVQIMNTGSLQPVYIFETIGITLAFTVFILTFFRYLVNQSIPWLQARSSQPGGMLTLIIISGLFFSAIAEAIGMHAVFGAFITGIAIGDSENLRESTREIIDKFITNIFSPLFFASLGLRFDFFRNLDVGLTIILCVLVIAGKFAASFIAGYFMKMDFKIKFTIGSATIASGTMGIILGLVALEIGIIHQRAFISIVLMAILTSLISAPLVKAFMKTGSTIDILSLLDRSRFIPSIHAGTALGAIEELSRKASLASGIPESNIIRKVWDRELLMSTGVGFNIAFPHARIASLSAPLIVTGISSPGVDFNSPDGEPAHLIFLILTPTADQNSQIQILSELSRLFMKEDVRRDAILAKSYIKFVAAIK